MLETKLAIDETFLHSLYSCSLKNHQKCKTDDYERKILIYTRQHEKRYTRNLKFINIKYFCVLCLWSSKPS